VKYLTKITDTTYNEIGSLSENLLNNDGPRTPAEKKLYAAFILCGLVPFPQYKFRLKGKTIAVDFAFPKAKIVVECDGKNHNTTIQKCRDKKRDELLWKYGWRVVRLKDEVILFDPDKCVAIVKDEIESMLF
jgi:very-short-patch-repair endonuclease